MREASLMFHRVKIVGTILSYGRKTLCFLSNLWWRSPGKKNERFYKNRNFENNNCEPLLRVDFKVAWDKTVDDLINYELY